MSQRRLAEDFQFGNTLMERFRDQLVGGLRDESIQGRLLAEMSLTYNEPVKRAHAGRAAATQVKELQAQKPSIDILTTNQLRQTNSAKKILPRDSPSVSRNICASCAGSHSRKDCKFRNAECNFCHKKGHIDKVCRNKAPTARARDKKKGLITLVCAGLRPAQTSV
ncbi:hypothetical protein M513_07764 [Trichuris suis]|uniref:CCHC-type domain-containing protein n=1 Tax=Trichuris suis TaxID=68888 RepID=A0A085M2B3_9BILA|nr:hypothetical protein M513_07764 [Trichuris suis]